MGEEGLIGGIFRRTTCPCCLNAISLADCAIIDADSGLLLWEPRGIWRIIGRVRPRSLHGARFRSVQAARQCPGSGCRARLPRNVDYAAIHTVQFLGCAGPDRARYRERLHVLLAQQSALSQYHIGILQVEEAPRRRVDHLASRSRVYSLLLSDHRRQRSVNLVLHDQDGGRGATPSGLVVMIDPTSLPGVLERLPERQRPERPDPVGEVAGLLLAAAEHHWLRRGRRQGTPIPTPLSIVITRADRLRQVAHGLGHATGPQTDVQVEGLLRELGGSPIVDAARLFGHRRYHSLPVLDEDAAGAEELEPLLWILRELRLMT